jgi:chromosome segregation ATPase
MKKISINNNVVLLLLILALLLVIYYFYYSSPHIEGLVNIKGVDITPNISEDDYNKVLKELKTEYEQINGQISYNERLEKEQIKSISDKDARIVVINARLTVLDNKINDIKDDITQNTKIIYENTKIIKENTDEITRLMNANQDYDERRRRKENGILSKQIKKLVTENTALNASLIPLNNEKTTLTQEKQKLETEKSMTVAGLQKTQAYLKTKIELLSKNVDDNNYVAGQRKAKNAK